VDLSSLRFLISVADTGTVTAAAKQLHCVQSNVTARLKHLEDEAGVPLFQRVGRRLVMTPHGQTLLDYARRIQRLTEEARRATQAADRPAGPLRLGAMETTASLRLAPLVPQFHRRYPEVRLSLETGTTTELIERVLGLDLDGALVAGPVEHAALAQEPVYVEELVLVSEAAITDLEDLAQRQDLGLLLFKLGCNYRDTLERWAQDTLIAGYRTLDFGSVEAILSCAAAGVGVSVMPRTVVEASPVRDTLRIHPLPQELRESTTVLIYRRDCFATGAFRAFKELLQERPLRDQPRSAPPKHSSAREATCSSGRQSSVRE
jgi:DNA-binding transcriptional LysR family regulator